MKCLQCDKPLLAGRSDKKFCNDYCRQAYNNKRKEAENREIRNINLEFQDTARNMETLRQWASVSDGLAVKVEDCRDAADLARAIIAKVETQRQNRQHRQPIGINVFTLGLVLGCLGGEWILRKRLGLV